MPVSALRHSRITQARRLIALAFAVVGIGSAGAAHAAWVTVPGGFENPPAQLLRVASVSYRIAVSNRELCRGSLVPQLGLVLEYPDAPGPLDAARPGPRIVAVVADSPADKAGLAAGDELISLNGVKPAAVDQASDASAAQAGPRAAMTFRGTMADGEVIAHVAGPLGQRDLHFAADFGCPSDVELTASKDVNAWADGERITMTSAIVAGCNDDDELALVIAHEMAHNILHHRQKLSRAGVARNGLLPISAAGTAIIRETEEEADHLAVRMAGVSGYDLSGAPSFLERLLNPRDAPRRSSPTHPNSLRRLALLRAAIADIVRLD